MKMILRTNIEGASGSKNKWLFASSSWTLNERVSKSEFYAQSESWSLTESESWAQCWAGSWYSSLLALWI